MSKTCPLCKISDRPTFDVETDEGLAEVLEHYLEEHPESDRLSRIVDRGYVERQCNDCERSFWAVTKVNTDARGEILADAYCPECEQENVVRAVVVTTISPLQYVRCNGVPFDDGLGTARADK